ncbi:MAG TPA: gentisate 1,2-dioxygenase [Casimicrobiaceae bacterium]|nr:gentisate 1,2-dioxygenase [Casimicrobiaceae bacterium]
MNDRAAFAARIADRNLRPLWDVLDDLVPPSPQPAARAALWRYDDVRPALMESGALISAMEAVRRVLILENPGLPGSSRVSGALYAGLQLILPGEVAPSHRHSQSALRFVVEGSGAYTSVDGERTTMAPGDFIITPSWTWHDHGNEGGEPVVWLDGLDIPIVALHDAQFAERYPAPVQPLVRTEGDCEARWGSNMALLDHGHGTRTSPVFSYPYARSRAALATVGAAGGVDAAHGVRMRYVNPVTGGWSMPTLGTWLQWLPAGFRGRPVRSTDATVFCCVEGHGRVRVDGKALEWGPRDVFVVPSWQARSLEADEESVLFGYSDRPVQEALGLLREERGDGG